MLKQAFTCLTLCLLLALPLAGADGSPATAAPQTQAISPGLLQFQSGGHVLGFAPDGMVVSNGTYALRVEFVGATTVSPQANTRLVAELGGGCG